MTEENPEDHPGYEGNPKEIELLNQAIQRFVNAMAEKPVLIVNSVVLWEATYFDDEGSQLSQIRYSIPTDGRSLAGSLGLIEAGGEFVRRDILGLRTED